MSERNLGDRYNSGKPQWSLVPFSALEPMVRVLEFGASKYAKHNWKKGLPYTETCESMLRHIYAFMEGEDNDPESGQSHIGHIMCNALFLSYFIKNNPELDNRENAGNISRPGGEKKSISKGKQITARIFEVSEEDKTEVTDDTTAGRQRHKSIESSKILGNH